MNGWNIAVIAMMAAGVAMSLALDGKPREGKHSFWTSLVVACINAWILYKAGLWG